MRSRSIFLAGAGLLVLAAGCSDAAPSSPSQQSTAACEPGTSFECFCANGTSGTQSCNESGTAVSSCDCTGASDATGGLPPASGSGGAPAVGSTGGAPAAGGTGGAGASATGGAGGTSSTGGTGATTGTGGTSATGGTTGTGGTSATGGTGGTLGTGGTGGTSSSGGTGGMSPTNGTGTGTCCSDGDCLCHGPDPTGLTSASGPFNTTDYSISTGTVHYPTDAEPPFAAVALCGGFLNTGPEMADWGPFYASHGIVTVITTTLGSDQPATRARKLLDSIDALKAENTNPSSPLFEQLAGRYGTSGYSMGGGGTTIATTDDPTLRTSVGLAAWAPTGAGVQVPTLLLCGSSDGTAPCSMSEGAYAEIPESTPKMMVTISGASHFSWFGPTDAGGGVSGETALAFQKVFLEGDERWRPFLLQSGGMQVTNIQ